MHHNEHAHLLPVQVHAAPLESTFANVLRAPTFREAQDRAFREWFL